ncbi:hypothetical protein EIN_470000 [Entamoeba invadens IP1]|uniref:Uncharacterized protein n=1 Tax=Entamoeba invadens IP1 TaxID=370355 RepID=A0A0A1TZ09_ENTIV|nr:hypothetical protein EIN_470000 [Entamoeba invadens IP1]ELP83766.1 hypothetical protein EIN_470000 [Entamoeba invadens IP1]|eukprot:XP_004183112.1 hypothetical protein EIN_470000 [Entamoeba invadens IP1]
MTKENARGVSIEPTQIHVEKALNSFAFKNLKKLEIYSINTQMTLQTGPTTLTISLSPEPHLYFYVQHCLKAFISSMYPPVTVSGDYMHFELRIFPPYPCSKIILENRLSEVDYVFVKVDDTLYPHLLRFGQGLLARNGILGCLYLQNFGNKLVLVANKNQIHTARRVIEETKYATLILRQPTLNNNMTCKQLSKHKWVATFILKEANIDNRFIKKKVTPAVLSVPVMNVVTKTLAATTPKQPTKTKKPKPDTTSEDMSDIDFIKPKTVSITQSKKVTREYFPKFSRNFTKEENEVKTPQDELADGYKKIQQMYAVEEKVARELDVDLSDNAFRYFGYADERNLVRDDQLTSEYYSDLLLSQAHEKSLKDETEKARQQRLDREKAEEDARLANLKKEEERRLLEEKARDEEEARRLQEEEEFGKMENVILLTNKGEDYTVEKGLTVELRHVLKWHESDVMSMMNQCEVDYEMFSESISVKGNGADGFCVGLENFASEVMKEEVVVSVDCCVAAAVTLIFNKEGIEASAWYFGPVILALKDPDFCVNYCEREIENLLDDDEENQECVIVTATNDKNVKYAEQRIQSLCKSAYKRMLSEKEKNEVFNVINTDSEAFINSQVLEQYEEKWFLISFNENVKVSLQKRISFKL